MCMRNLCEITPLFQTECIDKNFETNKSKHLVFFNGQLASNGLRVFCTKHIHQLNCKFPN